MHEAIDRADLILAIGHDTVEKPPFLMGPGGPTVIHVGYTAGQRRGGVLPARIASSVTSGPSLLMLADRLEGQLPNGSALLPLRDFILGQVMEGSDDRRFPIVPQRIVADVRKVMPTGRDRGAGQRHVQDLVCPELPHPDVQHAAAGQCAGHHGSRPAVGDDGRDHCIRVAGFSRYAATAGS